MPRSAARFACVAILLTAAACEKVALLAPTGSTVTISVSSTALGGNGSAEVVATVIEAAGTPVHNGTEVRFQASVGRMDPDVVRTEGGVARTTFRANGASGTAAILAFSGGAKSTEVMVRVGSAAAETLTLRTNPSSLPQAGGPVQVIATVRDPSGNPVSGAQVAFSTNNGTFSAGNAPTDDQGEARTILTTNRESTVTASVAGKTATINVTIFSVPTATLSFNPAAPLVGVPVAVTVTPSIPTGANAVQSISVDLGDGTVRNLGAITIATTFQHTYQRADTYTVTATVVDSTGTRNTFPTNISVQRPVIAVAITQGGNTPGIADAGTSVTFTVAITGPESVNLGNATIDFGNGLSTLLPPRGGPASTVYNASGRFTVRAFARDQAGNVVGEATQVIEIRPRAALGATLDATVSENTNAFTCSTTQPKFCQTTLSAFVPAPGGQPGVRVTFTAALAGLTTGIPAAFTWDFNGDGTADRQTTSGSTDNLFTVPGTFTIRVRITTTDGNFAEQTLTLLISP